MVVRLVGARASSVRVRTLLFTCLFSAVHITWRCVSGSPFLKVLVMMAVLKRMLLLLCMLVWVLGRLCLTSLWTSVVLTVWGCPGIGAGGVFVRTVYSSIVLRLGLLCWVVIEEVLRILLRVILC